MNKPERAARRVRYELKFRMLQVRRVQHVTPHLVRVTLTGPDLDGFTSVGYDDHVKVFFPEPGQDKPSVPEVGPNGPVFTADKPRSPARDYTPRRYDAAAQELDIEFALHGHGPAALWAANAQPGQYLGVGGPRGSFVIDAEFDGYLLVGDETALPAIARRLEELPAHAQVLVVAEVAGAQDEQQFQTRAQLRCVWVHRGDVEAGDPVALTDAVAAQELPAGDVYAWVAAESAVAKSVRRNLVDVRAMPKEWVKAAGYWKRGSAATHDKHED